MAVRNLMQDALDIAKINPNFRTSDFDTFERVLWTENSGRSMYGLPPTVFKRALKEAHRQITELATGMSTKIAGT